MSQAGERAFQVDNVSVGLVRVTVVQTHTVLLEAGERLFVYPSDLVVPHGRARPPESTVLGELMRCGVTATGEVVRCHVAQRSETWSCSFESESAELLPPPPKAGPPPATSSSTLIGRLLNAHV